MFDLLLEFGHPLGHEVEEGELAGVAAMLVDETTGQVAAEDGAEVVVGNLESS